MVKPQIFARDLGEFFSIKEWQKCREHGARLSRKLRRSPPGTSKYQRESATVPNVAPIATASIMLKALLVVSSRQEQAPLGISGHHQSPASPHSNWPCSQGAYTLGRKEGCGNNYSESAMGPCAALACAARGGKGGRNLMGTFPRGQPGVRWEQRRPHGSRGCSRRRWVSRAAVQQ